ncbi:hypothetical protein PTTG_03236, partial [Puccinia triticina 1-1 BBBD Race 1]
KPEKPEEVAAWSKKNKEAYFEIIDHVDVEHMTLIGGSVPPNQQFNGCFVWNILKAKYAANDDVAKLVALESLNELEYTTIPAFIAAVRQINQRLTMANFDLGNLMVLAKLPRDRFQSFRDIITMAQNKILTDENYRPDQAALFTSTPSQLTCPSCKKTFKICTHCQKTGHSADMCYQKHPDKRPTSSSTPQVHFAATNDPTDLTNKDEQAYFLAL